MGPNDQHDGELAVWPCRRRLDELEPRAQTALTRQPAAESTQPLPIVQVTVPRRSTAGPLRFAIPLALVVFCAALAGSAAFDESGEVEARLNQPLVQAAEAAAKPQAKPQVKPKPRRHVTAATVKRSAGKHVAKSGPRRAERPQATTAPPPLPPLPTQRVIVTSVVGLPRDVAAGALRVEGLDLRVYEVPSARPAGTVVAQHPRGGVRADAGSAVRVNVAAR